jgi:hypothetical protein
MGLDLGTQQLVLKWMTDHCPRPRCSACGCERWGVSDLVALPVVPGPPPGTGHFLPFKGVFLFVPVSCRNCGATVLHNARMMGIGQAPAAPARTAS